MKHAILVMGYGNYDVLQGTINLLDDKDIDFIIHWDKKYPIPNLKSNNSKIIFIQNRIRVRWGTDLQTIAEKMLFEKAYSLNYDYIHLISSTDIPLMDSEYFKSFFKKDSYYVGFIDYLEDIIAKRMKYYYPIRFFNVKPHLNFMLIIKSIKYINTVLKVDRLKNVHVEKGCNWLSMDSKFLKRIVEFDNFKMFKNTFTGDEFYVQTILRDLKPKSMTKDVNYFSDSFRMQRSSNMALRYIDWLHGGGKPYVFKNKSSDIEKLSSIFNTNYAFARKVDDPNVLENLLLSTHRLNNKNN